MATVNLSAQSRKSVLITRPSARMVASAMHNAAGDGTITLDTRNIRRIGVSFFDEALLVLRDIIRESGNENLRLVYHTAPTMQSLKNLVAHRGFVLHESANGDWIISRNPDGSANDDAR